MLCKWLSPLANQLIDRRHLAQFPLGSKNKGVIYQKMQLDARAQFSRKNHRKTIAATHRHEGIHQPDTCPNGNIALQNSRLHRDSLFCKGAWQRRRKPQSIWVVTNCDDLIKFLFCQLETEIIREAIFVTLNRLVERTRRNLMQIGKILLKQASDSLPGPTHRRTCGPLP